LATVKRKKKKLVKKKSSQSGKRAARAKANDIEASPLPMMGAARATPSTNGKLRRKRRATAQSMAASQRDISVSEFFAKNRHLLGFDNPRKALLTTIKEAVDNSLDACEEAGILPEIWVHVEQTGTNRFKIGVQDNGPGILKKQIPLIFGKLLYGSKFHRLRQSRGQQGIGISAAGMYGVQTTGKPVKIISKVSVRKPTHYYEIQIDTKVNKPKILNGRGDGVDIPPGDKGLKYIAKHGIEWEQQPHGTRVTIELEAKYVRGRGSVDEYLEQTAIANPHVTLHYLDPDENRRDYSRSTEHLPPEPKEILPHLYGVEMGRLASLLHETEPTTLVQFLISNFSRVTPGVARRLCRTADLSSRANSRRISRDQVDALYQAIQATKISPPSTDCICPIGEELLLEGLHQVVPGEFYTAATRPPGVYRGNPFQIEVALAYGGQAATQNISRDLLLELVEETDARTIRQFLINTFNGLGSDGADRIVKSSGLGTRTSPGKLKPKELAKLLEAMKNVNISEGQTMNVMRFANRVPLQFQHAGCAITQTILGTNWRSYGLSQSRGALPKGPVNVMVHMASVWVPFTSESKEAVANYPEIQKEIRLGLQAVGRKLGMYLRRRLKVKKQADRREIFLRYLKEVAGAVSEVNGVDQTRLYEQLVKVAKKRTSDADMKLDDRGRPIEDRELDLGENVLIVDPTQHQTNIQRVSPAKDEE
jgi:DNA topoisomerase-6 subunit B